MVCVVGADPVVPGRAFVQLGNSAYGCSEYYQPIAAYETDDYGQSWHVPAGPPSEWTTWRATSPVTLLSSDGSNVKYDQRIVWTLPRTEFRQLVYPAIPGYCGACLVLSSVAPAGQGVLYAALGQYGVLVGPNPAENVDRPWRLVSADFAGLTPMPLSLTDLRAILLLVLFMLAIPPLVWIHAWLLGQAWRYMFPPDEQRTARRLASRVSFGLSAFTGLALAFW